MYYVYDGYGNRCEPDIAHCEYNYDGKCNKECINKAFAYLNFIDRYSFELSYHT